MLVMSRRAGEAILIGEEIEIVIAHIGRTRVKVGIRAPRQTPVMAREMRLVREENMAAAGASRAAELPGLLARLRASQVSPEGTDENGDRQEAGIKN
ncbi:MAG: carbon storage regulator [Bryobacteraceae bacterium]|jgi:carbon storage regulator